MPTIGRHHHGSTRGQYPAVCSICGVPWPRSKMQRTMGGLLVCPDDRGPDAATLDKLNARAAKRRQEPAAGPDLYVEPYSDPATILGDDLVSWFRVQSFSDAVSGDDGLVAKLVDLAGESGGGGEVDPSMRARLDAARGALVGDSGPWAYTATFDEELAAGSRPYLWLVASCASSSVRGRRGYGVLRDDGLYAVVIGASSSQANFALRTFDGTASEEIVGPALDTGIHLFEGGLLVTAADRFVVDGVGYDGALTASSAAAVDRARIGATAAGLGWDGFVYEGAVASSAPTAAQLAAMRSYFAARHTELDIA